MANDDKTFYSTEVLAFLELLDAKERNKLRIETEKMVAQIWTDMLKQVPDMTSVNIRLDKMTLQPDCEHQGIIIAAMKDHKDVYAYRIAVFEKRWRRSKLW